MIERPILFSAPMVRALLAGTKTQTRRVWKMPRGCDWYAEMGGEREGWFVDHGQPWWLHVSEGRCPYGHPGDRLWVREPWGLLIDEATGPLYYHQASWPPGLDGRGYKPSIHMPRAASRITLEVTGVRVERLNDISEADAKAEGISYHAGMQGWHTEEGRHFHCVDPRESYAGLWEQINGAGSWDANPWVWVVDFRTVVK